MRFSLFLLVLLSSLYAEGQSAFQAKLDLINVKNDKVKVELNFPTDIDFRKSDVIFALPNVIPGSYSEKCFTRFVSDISAYDIQGKPIEIKKQGKHRFRLDVTSNVGRIEYWVDDTWDDIKKKKYVFPPGGSSFSPSEDFYLLNFHAIVGLIEGYEHIPYRVHVVRENELIGVGSLPLTKNFNQEHVWLADSYHELVDNPIFYGRLDTCSYNQSGTKVSIAVVSKTGMVQADTLRSYLKPVTRAIEKFLGQLPVDSYSFLFYFDDPDNPVYQDSKGGLSGFGALEHNRSSVYYLPESRYWPGLKRTIQDIGAHEFLHIVTPLNLRSEEIKYFDFLEPNMSKHLWLYEGVTEYFSLQSQLQDSVITEEEFKDEIEDKITRAGHYPIYSFTEMSKEVISKKRNQKRYANVYQRGAILALILDIHIHKTTNGKYSLRDLVMDLVDQYGSEKAFKDEQLFTDIKKLTNTDTRQFIADHIEGDLPMDLSMYLGLIGWEFKNHEVVEQHLFPFSGVDFDDDSMTFDVTTFVRGVEEVDYFTDPLIAIAGERVTVWNTQDLIFEYLYPRNEPATVDITVLRKEKEEQLTLKTYPGTITKYNVLTIDSNLCQQSTFRNKLLFNQSYE